MVVGVATVVVVVGANVVVVGANVVVVGANVVVVVGANVVVVVVGGCVAGLDVAEAEPGQGNGVPQLKVGEFTKDTVRPIGPLSATRPLSFTALRSSFVFATADTGPDGVKAEVYKPVPFTK